MPTQELVTSTSEMVGSAHLPPKQASMPSAPGDALTFRLSESPSIRKSLTLLTINGEVAEEEIRYEMRGPEPLITTPLARIVIVPTFAHLPGPKSSSAGTLASLI